MMDEAKTGPAPVYFEGQGKFRGFTGNGLKLFAMAVMLVDHIAYSFQIYNSSAQVYLAMRIIGRFAFPIFAYMIAVGARHTHDIRKYLLRLFVFAFISELPFDLAFGFAGPGKWLEFTHQNVFFTLFLGLLVLALTQVFQKRLGRVYLIPSLAVLLLMMAAAEFLNTDYAGFGVLSIFLFYMGMAKDNNARLPLFFAAIAVLAIDWAHLINTTELFALAALGPILLHNGQRGTKMNKWVFYVYYPGHLLALYLIKLLVKG